MKLINFSRKLFSYKNSLILLNLFIFSAVLYLIATNKMFRYDDSSVQANEVDLAGLWKIDYEDKEVYASPSYDDSEWCLIDVPRNQVAENQLKEVSPESCKNFGYDRAAMRHSTFWYRKWIDFKNDKIYADPSLFLGSIKRKAIVYWDGEQIGNTHYYNIPNLINLSNTQLLAGKHLLAVRVETWDEAWPGILHNYPRKVTIGEWDNSKKALKADIQEYYIVTLVPLIIQVICFFIACLLALNVKSYERKFYWQSFYFGFSALYLLFILNSDKSITEATALFYYMAEQGIVSSLIGLISSKLGQQKVKIKENEVVIFCLMLVGLLASVIGYNLGSSSYVSLHVLKGLCISGLTYIVYLTFTKFKTIFASSSKLKFEWHLIFEVAVAFIIFFGYVYKEVFNSETSLFIYLHVVSALLSLSLIYLGVKSYLASEQRLAFYGRFVRAGLKQWLNKMGSKLEEGKDKKFIGRQLPIMKIDIVGFSIVTDAMPYGARRIYQDLWYYTIDSVLTENTLLDKGEGDGSTYYMANDSNRGCSIAVTAAIEIIKNATQQFDLKFKNELRAFLKSVPEMRAPMDEYVKAFKIKTGKDFWNLETEVRAIFVYDYVDEGLWGAIEYSHYDLSGPSLVKLARLEKLAGASELIMGEGFYKKWISESPSTISQLTVTDSTANLKGLGLTPFKILRFKSSSSLQKAQ